MSLFNVSLFSPTLLAGYLKRLGLQAEAPSLEYLNRLIYQHQHSVPFENFTRICDFKELPAKFPTLEQSLQSIINGAGCVCWTHARAFHWLLKQLGFKTDYLYMEPGHVCVKVTLDQEYYVDVGYAAPFFEARSLRQSFVETAPSETFAYEVGEGKVVVIRTPGPTKTLHLTPFSAEQIEKEFLKGNLWGQNRFLTQTVILKYVEKKLIRLNGQTFTDFRSGKRVEKELSEAETNKILTVDFEIDPNLHARAKKWLL